MQTEQGFYEVIFFLRRMAVNEMWITVDKLCIAIAAWSAYRCL